MSRLLVPGFAAFLLAGCGLLTALPTGVPPAPVAVADKTVLDEKLGTAVETIYTAAARAGALAFKLGIVKPSPNPAVQRDDFCKLVLARLFEPTDRGSSLMAVECRLRAARDLTRQAYDTGNAASYGEAAARAIALGNEMLALVRGD